MRLVGFLSLALIVGCSSAESKPDSKDSKAPKDQKPAAKAPAKERAMWTAPIKTLQGKDTKLESFKGKALLLVNVASKCGLTPQYTQLEELQKKYADKGFTVVGFPCNQFGGQEPGTAEEIETFCSKNYGVTFPMMEKIDVNGEGRHPIYTELTAVADAEGHAGDIRWNFEKFLVGRDGAVLARFAPQVEPDAPEVTRAIVAAL